MRVRRATRSTSNGGSSRPSAEQARLRVELLDAEPRHALVGVGDATVPAVHQLLELFQLLKRLVGYPVKPNK